MPLPSPAGAHAVTFHPVRTFRAQQRPRTEEGELGPGWKPPRLNPGVTALPRGPIWRGSLLFFFFFTPSSSIVL